VRQAFRREARTVACDLEDQVAPAARAASTIEVRPGANCSAPSARLPAASPMRSGSMPAISRAGARTSHEMPATPARPAACTAAGQQLPHDGRLPARSDPVLSRPGEEQQLLGDARQPRRLLGGLRHPGGEFLPAPAKLAVYRFRTQGTGCDLRLGRIPGRKTQGTS
jgi:hypothetical protein